MISTNIMSRQTGWKVRTIDWLIVAEQLLRSSNYTRILSRVDFSSEESVEQRKMTECQFQIFLVLSFSMLYYIGRQEEHESQLDRWLTKSNHNSVLWSFKQLNWSISRLNWSDKSSFFANWSVRLVILLIIRLVRWLIGCCLFEQRMFVCVS